jgi:hypothetical protein
VNDAGHFEQSIGTHHGIWLMAASERVPVRLL